MKNIFTLSFLLLLTCSLTSQIFMSKVYEGQVVVGPEQVSGNHYNLAAEYIEKVQGMIADLENDKSKTETQIAAIERKDELKWRDVNKLARLTEYQELLMSDLIALEELLRIWKEFQTSKELLAVISDTNLNHTCMLAKTNLGEYRFDELEFFILSKENNKEGEVVESIPVIYTDGGLDWVKKKADTNCISVDPEDCLVWCRVVVEKSYAFTDLLGEYLKLNACPEEYTFNKESSSCVRNIDYTEIDNRSLEVKLWSTGQPVRVSEWSDVACD